MKREIKFRGKKIDNNEWVYGGYFSSSEEEGLVHYIFCSINGAEPVIAETIGQFTGIKNVLQEEIYDGDIVKIEFKEAFNSKNYINISEVIWSESSLRWDVPVYNGAKHGLPLNWGGYESLEIIGNIHENKELLC